MAAITKSPMRTPRREAPARPASDRRTKLSPDYLALVLLLVIMTAIMVLAMWLANLGSGSAPADYWMLMP